MNGGDGCNNMDLQHDYTPKHGDGSTFYVVYSAHFLMGGGIYCSTIRPLCLVNFLFM